MPRATAVLSAPVSQFISSRHSWWRSTWRSTSQFGSGSLYKLFGGVRVVRADGWKGIFPPRFPTLPVDGQPREVDPENG